MQHNERQHVRFLNQSIKPFSSSSVPSTPRKPLTQSLNSEIEQNEISYLRTPKNEGLSMINEETTLFLLWELQHSKIPSERNTQIKFGFNRCENTTHQWYLFQVYYDFFFNTNTHIFYLKKVYYLNQAYLQDKLYDFIISTYEGYDEKKSSNHFIWFTRNKHISDHSISDFLKIIDHID